MTKMLPYRELNLTNPNWLKYANKNTSLSKQEICEWFNISIRILECMIYTEKFPQPDLKFNSAREKDKRHIVKPPDRWRYPTVVNALNKFEVVIDGTTHYRVMHKRRINE